MEKTKIIPTGVPNKFKVKLIGKSYVGKTSFINAINNNTNPMPHEDFIFPKNYKIAFYTSYKIEHFYFEEEPEVDFSCLLNVGITAPFYIKPTSNSNDYAAFFFMIDVSDIESLEYISQSLKLLYSNNLYSKVMKIIISNKNDLEEKLKQIKSEDVQKLANSFNLPYFEISTRDQKQVYDIVNQVYTKMRETVRINEYYVGIENGLSANVEKEKLVPNYYEICILGDKDSGKDCLKNKFLYDCCEKNIDIYEFCISRTINITGKEIKFDVIVKRDENNKDINSEFYYKTFNSLDPNCICLFLTYDISNNSSLDNLKKIIDELLDSSIRYKKVVSILGMKCDLLQENELEDKIKEGREVAALLDAHYYLVSNRTGFNVDNAFYDILVQAYNKYHSINDNIPTANYYKETDVNNTNLYSCIHVRNEKPKLKEKDKKKIEKQIEKELNIFKKLKIQKEITMVSKRKKDNELYQAQMKEILKLNYPKIFRCMKCWRIPKTQMNDLNNTLRTECIHKGEKIIKDYKINEYLGAKASLTESTICAFCKGNNGNHPHSFDYCFNCQKIFCKKCDIYHNNSPECRNISESNEDNNKRMVVPLYMIDSYCYKHDIPSVYYCVNCMKYTCYKCYENEHKKHVFKYYKREYVDELIKEKKQLIEREKVCYKFVQTCFNDFLRSLQTKFEELMDLKMKKLNIKEGLIKELELFKNNFTLIENVANIRFDYAKFLKFNSFETWKNKLNTIFDYLDEPLYIKSTNICIKQNIGRPYNILNELKRQKENEKNEFIRKTESEDIDISEKFFEKKSLSQVVQPTHLIDDIDNNSQLNQMLLLEKQNSSNVSYDCNIEGNPDDILITDICALSSKYFGISSDDGLLKIYNSYNYKDNPVNTIKEYLPNKGIYSLYKPDKGLHLDFNILYLIGFETIKKLIFNNDYTKYTINEEYTIPKCMFLNIIELQNIKGILVSTLQQEILSVVNDDKKKLIKTDLTYMINENKAGKEIQSIIGIGGNKFNVKLYDIVEEEIIKQEENTNNEKLLLRKKTIGNQLRTKENDNPEDNIKKIKRNVYNILIEVEHDEKSDKIILKNKYEFYKNFDILGKIYSNLLFIVDKNKENLPTVISLFDFNANTFIKKFYLRQNMPILYHKLENWVQNDIMFLLLDNEMNLTQYIFDYEKNKQLKPLYTLDLKEIVVKKNKNDNIILLNVGDKIFLFANNGLIFRINN